MRTRSTISLKQQHHKDTISFLQVDDDLSHSDSSGSSSNDEKENEDGAKYGEAKDAEMNE